jgi:hypothetical protein
LDRLNNRNTSGSPSQRLGSLNKDDRKHSRERLKSIPKLNISKIKEEKNEDDNDQLEPKMGHTVGSTGRFTQIENRIMEIKKLGKRVTETVIQPKKNGVTQIEIEIEIDGKDNWNSEMQLCFEIAGRPDIELKVINDNKYGSGDVEYVIEDGYYFKEVYSSDADDYSDGDYTEEGGDQYDADSKNYRSVRSRDKASSRNSRGKGKNG